MILVISAVATLLSLLGNYLVVKRKAIGFCVWIISNVFWIYVAIVTPNYPQIVMFVIYAGLNVYGIIEWKKGEAD